MPFVTLTVISNELNSVIRSLPIGRLCPERVLTSNECEKSLRSLRPAAVRDDNNGKPFEMITNSEVEMTHFIYFVGLWTLPEINN